MSLVTRSNGRIGRPDGTFRSDHRGESGYILIMSLFVLVIISLVGLSLAVMGINEYNLTSRSKIMDQAYAVAEAGVNRAAVQLRIDPSITQTVGTLYPNDPPQWGPHTEEFGGGGFTVSVWQSELVPTDPFYKVVRARGTITYGSGESARTAERTIETRIIAGAGGEDYDASFDYCIYNGFSDTGGVGTWPDVEYWVGHFTIDGATPYEGHSPKGAIYTRGSIDLPTRFMADFDIKGNIVATDDVTLSNAWETHMISQGINVNPGNVIAGIDGTGSASLDTVGALGLGTEPIYVSGLVCAPGNVTLTSTFSADFASGPQRLGGIIAGGNVSVSASLGIEIDGRLELGNVFSAGSTTIESSFGLGSRFDSINTGKDGTGLGVRLESEFYGPIGTSFWGACGPIYTSGKVDMRTLLSSLIVDKYIHVGDVHAGTDTGTPPDYLGGTGVYFDVLFGDIQAGKITSRGKVDMDISNSLYVLSSEIKAGTDSSAAAGGTGVEVDSFSLGYTNLSDGIVSTGKVDIWGGGAACTLGDVVAGTDDVSGHGGTGINVDMGGVGFSVGDLKAQGTVHCAAGGIGGGIGDVWSGHDIDLDFTGMGAGIGDLSSVGNLDLDLIITLGGAGVGRVSANGSADVYMVGVGASYVGGVKAGGNATLAFDGLGWMVSNDLDPWNDGPGSPDNTWSGYDPSEDSVCAGGEGHLHPTAGWLTLEGDEYHFPWGDLGDLECGFGKDATGWLYYDDLHSNVAALQGWTPGVDEPGIPARPAMPAYNGGVPAGTEAWLQRTPPVVDSSLLLYMAGLEDTVELLEPNWSYFEEAAAMDDTSNPSVPHMVYDTGLPADGDYDGAAGNGEILFKWDNALPYSSNETIYNGDANVNIILDVNWAGLGADFQGTIVSKGSVYIDNTQVSWFVDSSQTVNIVAGGDIARHTGGLALWTSDESTFHFWAHHNIDLSNLQFSLGGDNLFYGSFTAGNRLYYNSNTFFENTQWKWSRWALDPVAWVPPFEVLVWREL